ncbi:MAG: glutathione S-transferase N-terminal domain-containing protein [Gammaproteobacteria bacterium]|nr:glutathione S-transferase N-terminal domain-containing protein [Gammaproteobacteria bacterium]
MLNFYYAPGSCALATHIALEEAGADYEAVLVDFTSQQQRSAEYLAVNPKGRVPALVTDQGILTETPALLVYVAQCFPAAGLAPLQDAYALARVQSFNSYLCSTVHVNHAHRARGARWADAPEALEAMQRKVPQTMTESFSLIEREMFKGPWVMGEQYTICDPYLFTISRWLASDSVSIEQFPAVNDHHQRMLERPAVAKVMALHP